MTARTETELTGRTSWSAVSGLTGPKVDQLGARHRKRAFAFVRWWEHSDEACKFWVYYKNVAGSDAQQGTANLSNFRTEFCNGPTNGDQLAVGASTENEFVTGLQVCLTDKKDDYKNKLKGIRTFSRMWDEHHATLSSENDPVERKLGHCKKWSRKVSCSAGQVVTQLRVYSRITSDRGEEEHGYAQGIAIGCRELTRVTRSVAG
ncbi:MAG: hypothetical protein AAGA54_29850 [Myxococcota bacterium]